MAFDPYLGWVDVPNPAQPPTGAKMITASDLLRYERGIEQNETDIATTAEALNNKADLVGGKVPVGQLPTEALVTDSSVASQVNSPMTGAAIDARVEPAATSYLASQPAVVNAAAEAVNANPDISSVKSRVTALDGQGQRGYTISETAGRAIRVWDYLNNREQLIYGDTGGRDITTLGSSINGGAVRLSRESNVVQLTLVGATTSQAGAFTLLTLPLGFRPTAFIYGTTSKYWGADSAEEMRINTTGAVEFRTADAGAGLSIVLRFRTNDPWPTSLPGTAFGTIPYQ